MPGNIENFVKTTIPMPQRMVKFLHDLGIEARTGNGRVMAKTDIIRAVVEVLEEIDKKVKIDLSGTRTQDEIKDRIKEAIKKYNNR